MTKFPTFAAVLSTIGVCALAGCQGDAPPVEQMSSSASSLIENPADGDSVTLPLRIQLGVRNLSLRPAGINEPGTGHHHLFIDRDVSPVGEPIPTQAGIVHLGLAQTEFTIDSIPLGEHVIISVIGDFQHVRLADVATDTLRVIVVGR